MLYSYAGIEYVTDTVADKVPATFKQREYQWTHLATGNTGLSTIYTMSRHDFLNLLDAWNQQETNSGWRYDPID